MSKKIDNYICLPLSMVDLFIEHDKTDNANSVVRFMRFNKFVPDSDITIDELKKFRKWLAEFLLSLDQDEDGKQLNILFDDNTTHMLLYYAKDMYDDVVKYLQQFVPKQTNDAINSLNLNKCGCQSSTNNILSLYSSINLCDPLNSYRKAIYEKMVNVFSDIDFWKQFDVEMLAEIKRYVDGIIKLNLPLVSSDWVSDLYDCGCLSDENSSQERLIGILKDFSKSLGYLINEEASHNNFIGDTLNKWSSMLYEKMRWE